MKTTSTVSLGLFFMWVLVAIVDIWFDVISTATFMKITVTLALLLVLFVCVRLMKGGSK